MDPATSGVGLIGPSGMTGVPIILQTMRSPLRCVVQVAGESLRMSAEDLSDCMTNAAGFRRLMLAYVQATLVQTAHVGVCNARHSVDERLRRWLLVAHAVTRDEEIRVTHKLIASSLGVRRASVTVRLSELEKAKAIVQNRGSLRISDRAALECGACGCHRIIVAEFLRLKSAASQAQPGPASSRKKREAAGPETPGRASALAQP
jgi:CRP-like cAMP-binding protein